MLVKPQLEQVKFNSVARNHNGDVLLSCARLECYATSLLEVEAKTIMWAMTHAQSRNFQNVVF